MTENFLKFLNKVSEDNALAEKIGKETDVQVLIATAKDMGIELTEADFEKEPEELSDDELDMVAGGDECVCALGGGGDKDSTDKTCACGFAGWGYDT
jgi:predicted ribosomally synthesized peptide with nif11-like leader